MKKNTVFYILILFLFSTCSFGSVTLLLRHHDAAPASQVTVPVKVRDFLNIISIQGTIQFDQAISAFVSVQDFGIPGMNASSFGTTQTGNGKLTFSWFDGTLAGVTLPDTAIIFSVKFNVIGSLGQLSTLAFVSTPTIIEVINNAFGTETLVLQNGAIHVQNTIVTANVTLKMDTISGTNGSQVLVSLRGIDFTNINSIQGTIQFDPAVVSYGGIGYYGLPALASSNFGTSQISSGKLTFSWVDATLSGQNMADNAPLFTMIFNLTGNSGDQTILSFATAPTPWEITDSLLNTLSVSTVNGSISVTGSTIIQTLTLFGDSIAGAPSTQVVVPFRADNFNKIISMQGTLDFNTSVVTYAGVEQFGLTGMNASNFGTTQTGSGKLTFSWFDQALTGLTVTDSSVLFAVRYNIVGSIGQHSDINFVNSPTPVEVIDTSFNPVNTALYRGRVEILDLQGVTISNISNDSLCVGDSIFISYSKWGTFNSGNIFTVQLSNSVGSFASPVNIGDITSTTNGIIHAFIPLNSIQETQYNIRIIASDPSYTSNSFPGNISIFTYPIANAGNDTSVCLGENIALTATGGTLYHWSTNANTQSISVSPGINTKYFVTVTNGGGCSSNDSVLVTVNSLPSGQVTNDTTICNGNSVLLTAAGGINYAWSNGENNANNNVNPLTNTQYLVTISDVNSCVDIDTVNVSVISVVADAGSNQTICIGADVTFIATGGNTYLWSNSATTDIINVSPFITTTYYVTVTGNNSCSKTDSVEVTVNPLPIANAGNDEAVCIGNSTTLNASGGVQYAWSNGINASINSVSPIITTTYVVTVTDTNNCVKNDTVIVTVNSLPIAIVSNDTAICMNEPVILIASGGSIFLWSNNDITNSITVTPINTTTYFVTVTDFNGCNDTASVMITINNASADAGSDVNLCIGDTATLFASGGVSYQWSTSDNTQSIEVSPINQNTFYVTITSAEGCVAYDSVTVFVHQLPVADAGNNQSICFGNIASLSATGGITYFWNNGVITQGNDVSPANTSTFYVTVTDSNNCSASDSVTVTLNLLPTAITSNDTAVCKYQTVSLSASGGENYFWSNGESTQTINIAPLNTTEYFVTVTDNNGCIDTASLLVTILNTNASAGNDTNICAGSTINITATGGTLYVWNTGDNTASIIVSPLIDSTYIVTITNINNCIASDSVTIFVHQLPVASAGNDTAVCKGNFAFLNASGGIYYHWDFGVNNQSANVSADSTTTYFVTVTDGFGCSAFDSVIVIFNPLPIIFAGNDTSICAGTSANLVANGGLTYSWNNGAVTQSILVNPLLNSNYIVVGTDNNNCINSDTVNVFVNSVNAFAGNDTSVCFGNSVTLSASGGLQYAWNNGVNTFSIIVSPTGTTTYSVVVTDFNNCSNSDTVIVTVNSLPVVNLGADTLHTNLPVTLDAGSGFNTYLWSTSETIQTISVNAYDWYFITVTDVNTCSANDSVYVDIFVNAPNINIENNYFSIYPNPVNDFIYIESNLKSAKIFITDIMGKIIIQKNTFSENNRYNISQLLSGCYNIIVVTENKMYKKQIIKL